MEFDAQKEIPVLHNLGIEHIRQCRACCERTARHHIGAEEVLTDVQVMQREEIATNLLEHTEKLMEKLEETVSDLRSSVRKYTMLVEELRNPMRSMPIIYRVGYLVGLIGTFLAGILLA